MWLVCSVDWCAAVGLSMMTLYVCGVNVLVCEKKKNTVAWTSRLYCRVDKSTNLIFGRRTQSFSR